MAATLADSRRLANEAIKGLKRERAALERQRRDDEAGLRHLAAMPTKNGELARLVEVQARIAATEGPLSEVETELGKLPSQNIDDADVAAALAQFDALWATLSAREQVRIISLLTERVDFDGASGTIDITFRPSGIKALSTEQPQHEETAA